MSIVRRDIKFTGFGWITLLMFVFAGTSYGASVTVSYQSALGCDGVGQPGFATYTYTFSDTTATTEAPIQVEMSTNYFSHCDPFNVVAGQSQFMCSGGGIFGPNTGTIRYQTLVVEDARGQFPIGQNFSRGGKCSSWSLSHAVPHATLKLRPDPAQPTATAGFFGFNTYLGNTSQGNFLVSLTFSLQPANPTFRITMQPNSGSATTVDLTAPNLNVSQQLLRLGQTVTVQVQPLQNGTPGAVQSTTSTIGGAAPTIPTDSAIFTSPKALFADKVVLHFPTSSVGTGQAYFGIHSGTVAVTLAFQFSGSNYAVNLPLKVSTCADGSCTEKLGSSHPEYDALLLKFADRNGVPPQLLKAQIQQESSFNPNVYRYEPLTVDFAVLATANATFSKLKEKALQPWALAVATDCTDKTIFLKQGSKLSLSSVDATKREKYSLALDKDKKTPLCHITDGSQIGTNKQAITSADTLPSMENVFHTNDEAGPKEHWLKLSVDAKSPIPKAFSDYQVSKNPFTAQTVIAASYGLHQVLYGTAVGQGYKDAQGVGLSPGGLFVPSTSLDLGSEYVVNRFKVSAVAEGSTYSDLRELLLQFAPALRGFNRGAIDITVSEATTECVKPKEQQKAQFRYACSVINSAPAIQPGA
jgi:hypothetical protein